MIGFSFLLCWCVDRTPKFATKQNAATGVRPDRLPFVFTPSGAGRLLAMAPKNRGQSTLMCDDHLGSAGHGNRAGFDKWKNEGVRIGDADLNGTARVIWEGRTGYAGNHLGTNRRAPRVRCPSRRDGELTRVDTLGCNASRISLDIGNSRRSGGSSSRVTCHTAAVIRACLAPHSRITSRFLCRVVDVMVDKKGVAKTTNSEQ